MIKHTMSRKDPQKGPETVTSQIQEESCPSLILTSIVILDSQNESMLTHLFSCSLLKRDETFLFIMDKGIGMYGSGL